MARLTNCHPVTFTVFARQVEVCGFALKPYGFFTKVRCAKDRLRDGGGQESSALRLTSGLRRCLPVWLQNPSVDLPPDYDKASTEVANGGAACCSRNGNGTHNGH